MHTDVARQTYPYNLPDLPYPYDALEPHIDQKTLQLHHRAHHNTYVTKLNEALAKEPELQKLTLAQLLADPDKLPAAVRGAIVNNGGGHLLHDFFWNALAPARAGGVNAPGGKVAEAVNAAFGSFNAFREKFSDAAAKHFASGWVALVTDGGGKLEIVNLKDHTAPAKDKTGLIIIDVWEHAYYVKYQNRRPEFIEAFWNVVNWAYADEKFSRATAGRA